MINYRTTDISHLTAKNTSPPSYSLVYFGRVKDCKEIISILFISHFPHKSNNVTKYTIYLLVINIKKKRIQIIC